MASSSAFVELLAGPQLVAGKILDGLDLNSLGSLDCTCRGLRATLARQPDGPWKVHRSGQLVVMLPGSPHLAVQAAALRELGPYHPISCAASARTYLQRQSAVRRSLASGVPASQALLHDSWSGGCVTSDFARAAVLGSDSVLYLVDTQSGQQLRSWKFPQVQGPFLSASEGGWDAEGRWLALLFGGLWGRGRVRDSAGTLGLLFLDTVSAAVYIVDVLAMQPASSAEIGWACASFCPIQSMLMVQHGPYVDSEAEAYVFDFQSELLHSMHLASGCIPRWAPCRHALGLHLHRHNRHNWLVGKFDSSPVALGKTTVLAWRTPYTGFVLLAWRERKLAIVSVHSLHSFTELPHLLASPGTQLAWGTRLAMLSCEANLLTLYSLEGSTLVYEHGLSPAGTRQFSAFAFSLSGDGQLLATVTGFELVTQQSSVNWGAMTACHLAVTHLASGSMKEHPLICLPDPLLLSLATVRWSQDCTAVLVCDGNGPARELIRLAA